MKIINRVNIFMLADIFITFILMSKICGFKKHIAFQKSLIYFVHKKSINNSKVSTLTVTAKFLLLVEVI